MLGMQPTIANEAKVNVNHQANNAVIEKLQALLKQRDNEILILVNLMNKKKEQSNEPKTSLIQSSIRENTEEIKTATPYKEKENKVPSVENPPYECHEPIAATMKGISEQNTPISKVTESTLNTSHLSISKEDLNDRAKAFDIFRKSYRKNEAMEDHKNVLKEKYKYGKELGIDVNLKRDKIKELVSKIEQIRKENALKGLIDSSNNVIVSEEETKLQEQVSIIKMDFQKGYNDLKILKSEIETIQNMLEKSKERMQRDFEQWLQLMMNQSKATSIDNNSKGVIKDKKVTDDLAAFYKARDDIYKGLNKNI